MEQIFRSLETSLTQNKDNSRELNLTRRKASQYLIGTLGVQHQGTAPSDRDMGTSA